MADSGRSAAEAAATGADPGTPTPGAHAARFRLRTAGYCVLCDRIVERAPDGGCPAGHPAAAVAGDIPLSGDGPVPQLPRFNVAAFALPPVWGPAHGQWAGALFLPIWVFADSVLATAGTGTITTVAAVVVLAITLAFQAYFAKRANGVAWRRVSGRFSVEEFVRRERTWALVCVPLGALLLAWALYYRFVLA